MKGSWTTSDRRTYTNLNPFNLKVGDEIIFTDRSLEYGEQSSRGKLHIGKVIGIYPYIFHVEYYIGSENDIRLCRSFRKIDYQLGEVTRRDR